VSGNIVCPWCGDRFELHSELTWHWINNPECKKNRYANSQLQDKYNVTERVTTDRPILKVVR